MSENKEILIGNDAILDSLAQKHNPQESSPHPLQEKIEEIIATQLTEDEQEIFLLRYGEGVSIRKIATQLGYTSHSIIQVKLERIKAKVKEGLDGFI